MLRGVGLLKQCWVHSFLVDPVVWIQLPKQGHFHHLRGFTRLAVHIEPTGKGRVWWGERSVTIETKTEIAIPEKCKLMINGGGEMSTALHSSWIKVQRKTIKRPWFPSICVRALGAQGVPGANIIINRRSDACHVGRFRDVIAIVARPNQHIVCQMSCTGGAASLHVWLVFHFSNPSPSVKSQTCPRFNCNLLCPSFPVRLKQCASSVDHECFSLTCVHEYTPMSSYAKILTYLIHTRPSILPVPKHILTNGDAKGRMTSWDCFSGPVRQRPSRAMCSFVLFDMKCSQTWYQTKGNKMPSLSVQEHIPSSEFLPLLISIAIDSQEFLAAWDAWVSQAWTRKKTCFRLQSVVTFLPLLDHRNSNSWATTPHKHNMIWDRPPKTYITPEKWLEHYFPLGKAYFHGLLVVLGRSYCVWLCVVVYVYCVWLFTCFRLSAYPFPLFCVALVVILLWANCSSFPTAFLLFAEIVSRVLSACSPPQEPPAPQPATTTTTTRRRRTGIATRTTNTTTTKQEQRSTNKE